MDEIKTIFSDHEGYSLYEIIDNNNLLHLVIDFNLPVKTLNAISSKLSSKQMKNLLYCAFRDTCLEISLQKLHKSQRCQIDIESMSYRYRIDVTLIVLTSIRHC